MSAERAYVCLDESPALPVELAELSEEEVDAMLELAPLAESLRDDEAEDAAWCRARARVFDVPHERRRNER
jgi:hypothetical protein